MRLEGHLLRRNLCRNSALSVDWAHDTCFILDDGLQGLHQVSWKHCAGLRKEGACTAAHTAYEASCCDLIKNLSYNGINVRTLLSRS